MGRRRRRRAALASRTSCGAARRASRAGGATGSELHAKFLQDADAFTLDYGGLSSFYGGLEGLIGSRSHTCARRCGGSTRTRPTRASFEALNYGTMTTPHAEYLFVVRPDDGALRSLGLSGGRARWTAACLMRIGASRAPSSFAAELGRINGELAELHSSPLSEDELIAARCYTGPLYGKYNAVLRGRKSKSSRMFAKYWASCKGNAYTTTLHVINSAVCKLSQLTVVTKVFRGVHGGVLPPEFWRPDRHAVRGGVEWAFLSTTSDPTVAFEYASSRPAGVSLVFEFQQGLVDRGASLSWCSQYPHEREILFGPLTGLEVLSTRVEGSILVVSQAHRHLTNDAADRIVSRRWRLLREMGTDAGGGLRTRRRQAAAAAAAAAAPPSTFRARASNALVSSCARGRSPPTWPRTMTTRPSSARSTASSRSSARCRTRCAGCSRMRRVDLGDWSLRRAGRVETLCLWLQSEPAATALDLRRADPSLVGAASIGAALRANFTLNTVTVAREATLPVQRLSGHQPIAALRLSRERFGAVAGCVLSELIAFNHGLTSLDLSHNMLGQRDDAACIALGAALMARPAQLQQLKLGSNYIGLRGAVAIAEAFARSPVLCSVDLSANEIGGEQPLERLAHALGKAMASAAATAAARGTDDRPSPPPRAFILRDNQIDQAAATLLRQCLAAVPALRIDL